jgi:ATP-dependent Clp protease ATP-binding subunit ClpA
MNEAVIGAVPLSHRYISGRRLPDKAVSVLDTAYARVAISQRAIPPVEDSRWQIDQLEAENRRGGAGGSRGRTQCRAAVPAEGRARKNEFGTGSA